MVPSRTSGVNVAQKLIKIMCSEFYYFNKLLFIMKVSVSSFKFFIVWMTHRDIQPPSC